MPSRSEAKEHLRIIRSLMERATFYRAIAAPAAAVGGGLAVAASFAFGSWMSLFSHDFEAGEASIPTASFTWLWLGVLFVTATVNFIFLWRDARRRGDPFLSAGMRLALRAVLPSYAVAAWWTWHAGGRWNPTVLVPVWLISHGLALLATGHFSPKSLTWLGWAFLLAGLGLVQPTLATLAGLHHSAVPAAKALMEAQMWMACTFGLFHVIYAVFAWPARRRVADRAAGP